MSSTRWSTTGEFRQERYCSAPEFEGNAINGLAAAKRISLVKDRATREALWFIQWRSLKPGGLQQLCDELLQLFPERIGPPALRKLIALKREFVKPNEIQKLREECGFSVFEDEYWSDGLADLLSDDDCTRCRPAKRKKKTQFEPEEWKVDYYRRDAMERLEELPARLKSFCLDPKKEIADGVPGFSDLLGALTKLRKQTGDTARARLAQTAVSSKIYGTLDFWVAERRMILIEGVAGIGRTATLRAWCDSQGGLVRLIEVPSSGDDRSFFSSIARELGVARGTAMKSQEIKVRIEEMLATTKDVLIAFDESQYLWGQYLRPRKTPDRLLWIKTVFDSETPIALIAHTDFSKWQAHYVKQTLWTDEQFERRVNRRVILPTEHSADDMLKIAQVHFPQGDQRSWKLLAAYALGTEKKQASGIAEALASARYRAGQQSRSRPLFEDIETALIHDHGFMKPQSQKAETLQVPGISHANGVKHRRNVCVSPAIRA